MPLWNCAALPLVRSMFYDYDKLLSYNAILNFVVAERGVGKTYGAKKMCIKRFLRDGSQFVYIRRYKTELDTATSTFFDQLKNNKEFEGHKLEVRKEKKFTTFYCDNEICGFGIALSTANILKSTEFPLVKMIIYDEFMLDEGCYRYLGNEVVQFLECWETIARLRDVPVIFLGNAVSTSCPYFSYFNISVPYGSEFKTFKDGLILFNLARNKAYQEAKKKSRFGRVIEGTAYSQYAIENDWLRDSKCFIKKKEGNLHLWSVVHVDGEDFGVWLDKKTGDIYVSKDYDPNFPCRFAFDKDDHDETSYLQARRSPWFKILIAAYRNACLYFDNQRIKNTVFPKITKCLTY